jgi:ubiquinone/menaquinone biosynthesis C-methylase UbiE
MTNIGSSLSKPDVWALVTEYSQGSNNPDLIVYRRDLEGKNPLIAATDPRRWQTAREYVCKKGNFYNARILDVGCGFGWDAVALSLIGNNQVVASDILPSMIDGVRDCIDTMKQKGRQINVEPLVADICKTGLPSESFDGIVSFEAIEHVHSLEAMFNECCRLLKPGKRLLIMNDSNRYNTAFREAIFKMWKERDTSWDHTEWLKTEIRPIEHKDAKPYAAMREVYVKRAAPVLDEACGTGPHTLIRPRRSGPP